MSKPHPLTKTPDLRLFQFGDLPFRCGTDDSGEPWFALSDVCGALGLCSPHKVAERLEDDEKGRKTLPTPGGPQTMTIISEPGLYRVIFRSTKKEARRFQRWVFHKVLPEIRATGSYAADNHGQMPEDPPLLEREIRHPDGRIVIERFIPAEEEFRDRTKVFSQEQHDDIDDVTPAVPVEKLRPLFHRALSAELLELHEYRAIRNAPGRAEFRRRLNSRLKALIGQEREDWRGLDYVVATNWLLIQYGLDLRWILEPTTAITIAAERI